MAGNGASRHVQLVITGDPVTGNVQVNGPIRDCRLWQWLLGEAQRICAREATKQEVEAPKSNILLVKGLPPT